MSKTAQQQINDLGQKSNQNEQISQNNGKPYTQQAKKGKAQQSDDDDADDEPNLFQLPSVNQPLDQAKVKKTFTKLEKLLAQPDIFDTLRKIGNGQIRSYDDLDINATVKHQAELALK